MEEKGATLAEAPPTRAARPWAGNSVEHHQQMGQMMDQMVNQLGLGLGEQRIQQHNIDTAPLSPDVVHKKQGQPKPPAREIKALLRGAQSRDRLGLRK